MENNLDQQPNEMETPVQHQQVQPPHHKTRHERRRKKLILFVVGGIILALLLAGVAYMLLQRKGNSEQPGQATANKQSESEENTNSTPADSTPVVFKSTKLNIELTHRKDWTLKEAPTGEITITSPKTSYATLDGQSKTGVFTLKVRVGVPDGMKATIEKAIAVRDSEVIAYTDPPETQRYYTNLSYAGQKDAFNFFIVTGNTAIKAGNAFAYTLVLDSAFYLLTGGYGTDKEDTLAFDSVQPSAIDSSTVQQAIDIVKSLKIH